LTALVFGGDLGIAYLGTQGDNFDPIKDMALAGVGSVIAMTTVVVIITRYNAPEYWADLRQSLRIEKTVLGEEALRKIQNG